MQEEPRSLPAVRYYADGTSVLVATLAEFEALAPGHADHPDGPFPTPPADRWEVPGSGFLVPGSQPATTNQRPETTDPSPDPGHEARTRYVAGQSQQAIADAMGVSRYLVRQWLKEDD